MNPGSEDASCVRIYPPHSAECVYMFAKRIDAIRRHQTSCPDPAFPCHLLRFCALRCPRLPLRALPRAVPLAFAPLASPSSLPQGHGALA